MNNRRKYQGLSDRQKTRAIEIDKYDNNQLVTELKAKGLGVTGSREDKANRLKKYYGINPSKLQKGKKSNSNERGGRKKSLPKSNVVDRIERMEKQRQNRRKQMEQRKRQKADQQAINKAKGYKADLDYQLMIQQARIKEHLLSNHTDSGDLKLCVCVRKRPLFQKEAKRGDIDSVSCANPKIVIHEPKIKVDGITKYIENQEFEYDNTFNENETSEEVYKYSLKGLIPLMTDGGTVTCFAYGQTGSGKTYTMQGMTDSLVQDLCDSTNEKYGQGGVTFMMSFFEIYGGRCYDLLNKRKKLKILEDGDNRIKVVNLIQREAYNPKEIAGIIEFGHSVRTTHSTSSNDTSSRSHAICTMTLLDKEYYEVGKVILVDLAGSERAQDCQSNSRGRRLEGAEINKSLLALKECIRSMNDKNAKHVPFRASSLTKVLRDSFLDKGRNSRIVMIACVSPGSTTTDHTVNTLRYAIRLKSNAKKVKMVKANYNKNKNKLVPQKKRRHLPNKQKQINHINKKIQKKKEAGWNNILDDEQKQPPKPQKPPLQPKNTFDQEPKQNNLEVGDDKENDREEENKQIEEEFEKEREDLRFMKQTMRLENPKEEEAAKEQEQFFDFQQKATKVIETQEKVINSHMVVIKEDANLLTQESKLISNLQGVEMHDMDIDDYVKKLENVIKKKLMMYASLQRKLQRFKKALKDEEAVSKNLKNTFYY